MSLTTHKHIEDSPLDGYVVTDKAGEVSPVLVDHGAGIRTITAGAVTITRRIAKQLDRCDIWSNGVDGFAGLARVHTGTTVVRDRVKKGYRGYAKHLLDSHQHYKPYDAEPVIEVIGYYREDGELVIWQIGPGDLKPDTLSESAVDVTEAKAIRCAVSGWEKLPLAVLP
jgi:hypothetical protein